jgi:hypothetical protein
MSLRLLALTCLIFLSQVSLVQQSSTVEDYLDSVCGQGANLSGLVDKAQKRTLPELIPEPIGLGDCTAGGGASTCSSDYSWI